MLLVATQAARSVPGYGQTEIAGQVAKWVDGGLDWALPTGEAEVGGDPPLGRTGCPPPGLPMTCWWLLSGQRKESHRGRKNWFVVDPLRS